MKIDARHLVLTLLLGVGMVACSKGTYLEVRFIGSNGTPEIHGILVDLMLTAIDGGVAHSTSVIGADGIVMMPSPTTLMTLRPIKLPSSAAFKLDSENGILKVDATALGVQADIVATASTTTPIMHAQTWTVTLDFGGGTDAGAADGAGDGATTDGAQDGSGGGIIVTDGSITEGSTGCAAVTLSATDTVSLDYNPSGPAMDSLNLLWASTDAQRQFIGWMKFGLRAIPNAFKIMSADLNLTLASVTGVAPTLVVEYSSYDGWMRKTAAVADLAVTAPMSDNFGTPKVGVNKYPLFVDSNHDWRADIVDGVLTVGIDNKVVPAAGQLSDVRFQGVDHLILVNDRRPTLDLVICR